MLERFTWFRQSAMRYRADGLTVYIDPWGTTEDEPPADLILITHAHEDHLQPDEIARLRTATTKVVAPPDVAKEIAGDVTPVAPGESHEAAGVHFETVPAYNIVEDRLDKHPKANRWVGYVLELGGSTYYHAGDTDALPELESLDDRCRDGADRRHVHDGCGGGRRARARDVAQLAVPMHYGSVSVRPAMPTGSARRPRRWPSRRSRRRIRSSGHDASIRRTTTRRECDDARLRQALYVLAFDHRGSFQKKFFGVDRRAQRRGGREDHRREAGDLRGRAARRSARARPRGGGHPRRRAVRRRHRPQGEGATGSRSPCPSRRAARTSSTSSTARPSASTSRSSTRRSRRCSSATTPRATPR